MILPCCVKYCLGVKPTVGWVSRSIVNLIKFDIMRKNFIYLLVLAFMLSVGVESSAQNRGKRGAERAGDKKVCAESCAQRLSAKLMLDDATTAKFIPLYKEYMDALAACRMQRPEGQPTDAQRIENLKNRFEAQSKAAAVKQDYVGKFAKILTPRQVEQVMSGKAGMPSKGRMNGFNNKGRFAEKGDCGKKNGCLNSSCNKECGTMCGAPGRNGACADSAAVRK